MPSASSCFIANLQFSCDAEAFEVIQEKSLGSGHLHCLSVGCKIWVEKLTGAYFSAKTLLCLKVQELKLDFFFFFGGGSYFILLLKMFRPLSKIHLVVVKCNPCDSIYTIRPVS